jgi:hypothetical protein
MLRWKPNSHPVSGWLLVLLLSSGSVLKLDAQTTDTAQGQPQAASSRTTVLDSRSRVSLSDAYKNTCSNGGMLVITPDYKASEPVPANCETQPAILDLRRPDSLTGRLNVRNEGAVGDGKADDTAALQKAIQYSLDHPLGPGPQGAPVVYLPAGTYKVNQTLRIPAQMHLIGDGPETTTLLEVNPTANLITVYKGNCNDWTCNGSLENITLSGSGHLTTGTLVEIASADGFRLHDVKMYNHGGRGLQINYGSERFDSNNLYIYSVRWPIILAGDINESYFWNTQIIGPGSTNEEIPGDDKYCYSVNCVDGRFPGPNTGPQGTPTPVIPDTHAAIFVDKAVNFSFYGGSIKPLKYSAGIQVFKGDVSTIKNFYFEGYPFDKAGRLNAAVITGGAAPRTTLASSLSSGGMTASVADVDWMPHLFTNPTDINLKNGNYFPYVLLPQDYVSGSSEPSQSVPGLKRGQYEVVNIAGFGGDKNLYIASRNIGGSSAPANTSWPAGSIVEEMPYGFYGSLNLENSHINAIWPAGKGYTDACDQTSIHTCADIIVGHIPDGFYVDPNGGHNAAPGNHPYGASINIDSVTIAGGNSGHKGEIATHRFARIAFNGGASIPNTPQNGDVLDPKNLRVGIWEATGGGYLTAPLYATGHTAEPQVTFAAIGGVYNPAAGFFARDETQSGQGGYPQGGWMNGLQYANQYCWFDTPPAGQKQSTNRICMNGGPSNTAHAGYEYDVWSGSKWVNAFEVQGQSDGSADVSITGNLTVAKTLYVKSIAVASGTASLNALKSSSPPASTLASGTTAAIGGLPLQTGQCIAGMVRVSGITGSMVATTSPAGDPGDGFTWQAYVSAANTVTVKVCAINKGTPKAVPYNVRVQ